MAEIILSENDKLEWAIKAFRRRVASPAAEEQPGLR